MSQKRTQPVFEKVNYSLETSFRAYLQKSPHLNYPWHFHPDIELVLITNGYGKRFVGDTIESYREGDLVLLGSNLPHVWLNDTVFYSGNPDLYSESIVIQINKDLFNPNRIPFPELDFLKRLINFSQYGIKISGENNLAEIKSLLFEILKEDGLKRLTLLFDILEKINQNNELTLLASEGYVNSLITNSSTRLNRVFDYVMNSYNQPINLDQIADIAGMNKSSFCRFFKDKTGKTFSNFINELRIGYASKLLMDESLNITQICFESGFQSISNFNKQFKIQTNYSPHQFRQKYSTISPIN